MTLPSLKKLPTTLENTTPTAEQGGRRKAEGGTSVILPPSPFPHPPSLTWLPAAALATLLVLSSTLSAFGAETGKSELKWRSPSSTSSAKNRLRDTNSASKNRLRDNSVKRVSHEENVAGPVLRMAGQTSDGYNSVVSPPMGEDSSDTDTAQRSSGQPPNGLEREIERPFELPPVDEATPMPEPMPEPMTEPMPEPQVEPMPLPMDDQLQQVPDRQLTPPTTPRAPSTTVQPDPFDRNEAEPRLPAPAPSGPTTLSREQQEMEKNCDDELAKLRAKTLATLDLSIVVTGTPGQDFPYECTVDDGTPFQPRCWSEVTYMWKASALCHKPLYFECEQMERYGHSWGPVADPLIAGAHFFSRLPVLPYCMGITPPNECIYALGHYRPGSCAPYMIDPIPFTCRAAAYQTAATVGLVYFLP